MAKTTQVKRFRPGQAVTYRGSAWFVAQVFGDCLQIARERAFPRGKRSPVVKTEVLSVDFQEVR